MSEIIGMGPKGPITIIRDESGLKNNAGGNKSGRIMTVSTVLDSMSANELEALKSKVQFQKKSSGDDSPVTAQDLLKEYYRPQEKTICPTGVGQSIFGNNNTAQTDTFETSQSTQEKPKSKTSFFDNVRNFFKKLENNNKEYNEYLKTPEGQAELAALQVQQQLQDDMAMQAHQQAVAQHQQLVDQNMMMGF